MTYRKGFTPMYRCTHMPAAGTSDTRRYIRLTSDAGWGCMIRVGQMLLATALKRHESLGGRGAAPFPPTGTCSNSSNSGEATEGIACEANEATEATDDHSSGASLNDGAGTCGKCDVGNAFSESSGRKREIGGDISVVSASTDADVCTSSGADSSTIEVVSSPEGGVRVDVGSGVGASLPAGDDAAAKAPEVLSPLERQFLDDPCSEMSPFSIFGFIRAAHGCEVTAPPPPGSLAEEPDSVLEGVGQAVFHAANAALPGRRLTQKLPGDWFGPTTISETIAALVEQRTDLAEHLAVYTDADGVLYEDEVRALAGAEPNGCKADDDKWIIEGYPHRFSPPPQAPTDELRFKEKDQEKKHLKEVEQQQDRAFHSLPPTVSAMSPATAAATSSQSAPKSGPAQPCRSGRALGGGESDDDFVSVGTASISSACGWSPVVATTRVTRLPASGSSSRRASPVLDSQRVGTCDFEEDETMAPTSQHESPLLIPHGVGGCDFEELECSSGLGESFELCCTELPPAALDLENETRRPVHLGRDAGIEAPAGVVSLSAIAQDVATAVAAALQTTSNVTMPTPLQTGEDVRKDEDNAPTPPRWQRAVLLLFPLQLGLEKNVSEAHVPGLLRYFELQASLGAMGGRPRMAHFFVGRQGHNLLYVDPHVVQPAAVDGQGATANMPATAPLGSTGTCQTAAQPALPPSAAVPPPAPVEVEIAGEFAHEAGTSSEFTKDDRPLGSVDTLRGSNSNAAGTSAHLASAETFRNTPTVQTIPIEHIDSSISFAFYCHDEADLQELLAGLKHIEASDANAPIRVEPTRPPALRLRHTGALNLHPLSLDAFADDDEEEDEDDSEEPGYDAEDEEQAETETAFTEVPQRDASQTFRGAPALAGAPMALEKLDKPPIGTRQSLPGNNMESQPKQSSSGTGRPTTERRIMLPADDDIETMMPSKGGGRIMVCSGWADGPWADVEAEQGLVVIEACS